MAGVEIDWVEGDAEDLPFEDDRFDVVLSTFGIQFAPRHEVAAAEAARVTRPGGAIGLVNWTPQGHIGQVLKTVGGRLPKPPELRIAAAALGRRAARARPARAGRHRRPRVRARDEPVHRVRLGRGVGRLHGDELRAAADRAREARRRRALGRAPCRPGRPDRVARQRRSPASSRWNRSTCSPSDGPSRHRLGGRHGGRRATPKPSLQRRPRIRLCGPLALEVDGRDLARALPGGQAGALLGYLLANRERAAERDELIEVLWPERAAARPAGRPAARPLAPAARARAGDARGPRAAAARRCPSRSGSTSRRRPRAVEARARRPRGAATGTARASRREAALRAAAPGLPAAATTASGSTPAGASSRSSSSRRSSGWRAAGSPLGGAGARRRRARGRELIARAPFRETGHRFLMEALGRARQRRRGAARLRGAARAAARRARAPRRRPRCRRCTAGCSPARPRAPAARRRAGPRRPPRVPLPALLSPRERSAFVARERELERPARGLATRRARAAAGSSCVAGEPGIGKTRLASEFAREAHADGTVLYAGCQEEALVSYQPFVEALRHYARSTELDWAQVALGPGARRARAPDPRARRRRRRRAGAAPATRRRAATCSSRRSRRC